MTSGNVPQRGESANASSQSSAASCSRCYRKLADAGTVGRCGPCWQREYQDLRAKSGIKRREAAILTWDSLLSPKPSYETKIGFIRSWIESDPAGILCFLGLRGRGKTVIGCVCVQAMLAQLRSARIITAMELLEDRLSRGMDGANLWREEWAAVDLLAIDEITVLDRPRDSQRLQSLIDSRYREMKPTILIGNTTPAQLAEFVGLSVAERCNDDGGCLVMFDDWPSFRK